MLTEARQEKDEKVDTIRKLREKQSLKALAS